MNWAAGSRRKGQSAKPQVLANQAKASADAARRAGGKVIGLIHMDSGCPRLGRMLAGEKRMCLRLATVRQARHPGLPAQRIFRSLSCEAPTEEPPNQQTRISAPR